MSESFQDYDLVKSKMDLMRTVFDEYMKVVEAMNTDIEDNINNGSDSALDSSILGGPFKSKWENLYTDFKNLEIIFSNAYNNVAATTKANAELEETTAAAFGSDAEALLTPDSTNTGGNGTGNRLLGPNKNNRPYRAELR